MRKPKKSRYGVTPGGPPKTARLAKKPEAIHGAKFGITLKMVDFDGPFGWGGATAEHFCAAIRCLKALESLTWGEVLVVQQKRNHAIDVASVAAQARERLRALGLDEYDELTSLRIQQAFRIWGIRVESTFALLWYDPNHKVYPMNIADN